MREADGDFGGGRKSFFWFCDERGWNSFPRANNDLLVGLLGGNGDMDGDRACCEKGCGAGL